MDRWIHYLFLIPGAWLIADLYTKGYRMLHESAVPSGGFGLLADMGLLSQFKILRNELYAAYIIISIILGMYIIFRETKTGSIADGRVRSHFNPRVLIPPILSAVILTTFAYAIAGLLLDVTVLLGI